MTTRYVLDCTECQFETTVDGTLPEVQAAIEAHRSDAAAGPTEHFVNVRLAACTEARIE